MHQLVRMYVHDDNLSHDIVQDVFASCLHRPKEISISAAYLFNAVRNRCLNHIRNLDIRQRIMNTYFANWEEYDDKDWPDEKTLAEIISIVRHELPPQCRRVVELRFISGMKAEEIGGEIGISPRAVFKHIRHALSIIRKKLKENG